MRNAVILASLSPSKTINYTVNPSSELGKLICELRKYKANKSPEQLKRCQVALFDALQSTYFRRYAKNKLEKYPWLSSTTQPDDVLQECYLKLQNPKQIQRMSEIDALRMYLHKVIQNKVEDVRRSNSRERNDIHGININSDISHLTRTNGLTEDLDLADWRAIRRETDEQEKRLEFLHWAKSMIYGGQHNENFSDIMDLVLENAIHSYRAIYALRAKIQEVGSCPDFVDEWIRKHDESGFTCAEKLNRTLIRTTLGFSTEANARMNLNRARRGVLEQLGRSVPDELSGFVRDSNPVSVTSGRRKFL